MIFMSHWRNKYLNFSCLLSLVVPLVRNLKDAETVQNPNALPVKYCGLKIPNPTLSGLEHLKVCDYLISVHHSKATYTESKADRFEAKVSHVTTAENPSILNNPRSIRLGGLSIRNKM